jgi:hypothetical protein
MLAGTWLLALDTDTQQPAGRATCQVRQGDAATPDGFQPTPTGVSKQKLNHSL